jgi:hypothetical protein
LGTTIHLNLVNTQLEQASGVLGKNHVEDALEVFDHTLGVSLVLVEHVEEDTAASATVLRVSRNISLCRQFLKISCKS